MARSGVRGGMGRPVRVTRRGYCGSGAGEVVWGRVAQGFGGGEEPRSLAQTGEVGHDERRPLL